MVLGPAAWIEPLERPPGSDLTCRHRYIGWYSERAHPLGGGGGALRYQMATHCQKAAWSRSGERQNLGAVNCLEGKKGGSQLVRCVCFCSILNILYWLHEMVYGRIGLTFVYSSALKKYDFRGQWSATLKNRGGQRKLKFGQPWKAGAVVWQLVATFKEAVTPPPPQCAGGLTPSLPPIRLTSLLLPRARPLYCTLPAK